MIPKGNSCFATAMIKVAAFDDPATIDWLTLPEGDQVIRAPVEGGPKSDS